MQNKRKNYFIELISKPVFITLLSLTVLVVIMLPLVRNIKQQYAINSEIAQLDNEIKSFEAKNLSLKEKMKYLQSDQFTNEQAKLNLNYKKEGEEVVVISTTTENPKSSDDHTNLNESEKIEITSSSSNPARWWHYFFY